MALRLTVLAPLCWIPGGFARFVLAKLLVTALAAVADLLRAQAILPRSSVVRRLVRQVSAAAHLGDEEPARDRR